MKIRDLKYQIACVVLVLAVLLTGCGQGRTTQEIIVDSYEKSAEIETAKTRSKITFGLELPNTQDPDLMMFAGFLSDITIDFESIADNRIPEVAVFANLDLGGMAFNGEIYVNEDMMVYYMPALTRMIMGASGDYYLVYDFEKMGQQAGVDANLFSTENMAKNLEASKGLYASMLKNIKSQSITDQGKQKITVNGTEIEAQEIQFTLEQEDLSSVAEGFLEGMGTEAFQDLMYQQAVTTDPSLARDQFDQDYQAELDEAKTQIQSFLDSVTFEEFTFQSNSYIDEDDYVIKQTIDFFTRFVYEGETLAVSFTMDSETYDINQPVTIEMPELNEENTIDMFQLMTP